MKDFSKFLGKRIKCTDNDGNTWFGTCNFIGINHLLHGQFQVTVGRMPVWPVDPKNVKLCPLPPPLFS